MKRFLLAVLFFAVLIALWEWAFLAKIWSPVLLPAPQQVAEYLKTVVTDGTLFQATVITMRRLLIGYVIGLVGAGCLSRFCGSAKRRRPCSLLW